MSTNEKLVQIQKLADHIEYPKYSTEFSAGFDLQIPKFTLPGEDDPFEEVTLDGKQVFRKSIKPGQTFLVKTGLKMAIPPGFYGEIKGRSSVSLKRSISILSGVVDSDYRGEVKILLMNFSNIDTQYIYRGERIAQMIILPCVKAQWFGNQETLPVTARGEGGFGSTGGMIEERNSE